MNVLGLSYDFHDASAALVMDGHLVGAAAEERYTLNKHDSSYPAHAISALLRQQGLGSKGVDAVVYYEEPSIKFARFLTCSFARFPRRVASFAAGSKSMLRDKLWVRTALSGKFGLPPRSIHLIPHHHSHVAQAFLASPFDEAAVLIVDGVGEWSCTTLAHARRGSAHAVEIIEQYEYPNSIGLVYAAFTAYLGFKPNSGESSTMALAAFGQPRFTEQMRRIFGCQADGTYRIDPAFFDFEGNGEELFTAALIDRFGPAREFKRRYPFDALRDEQAGVTADDQRCADIAASLQVVLTETLLGLAGRLKTRSGSPNLCFAGGVALNCLANSRLACDSGFQNFFIPPDPGDGGAAFGAALMHASSSGAVKSIASPYLGSSYSIAEVLVLLKQDPTAGFLLGRERAGVRKAKAIEWSCMDDDTEMLDRVADDLAAGRIVGWFQGRFELGPRALGNRSLLVDAGNLEAARRMSHTIKSHTLFRPYALSMTEQEARRVLHCDRLDQPIMKWMQTIWPVRNPYRDRLRAAVHVDGTTRPQVLSEHENPRFWNLLRKFGQRSGVEALLNTSFNERSLPMVGPPELALAMFARTGIDSLAIENLLLRKVY